MKFSQIYKKYTLNLKYSFRINKPLLILRLVYTFLGIIFLKKKPLRYVDFAIGYNCNLNCKHCFATSLKKDSRQKIDPNMYKGIVKQAMKLGAVNFSFQGGEPFLYPELEDFIKNSFPKRNLISVTTNGTLVDEHQIQKIKKMGVDILTISLDSAVAEEHDRFRGVNGTFDKTMKTIKMALKNGLNVTLGAVVSHQNIRNQGLFDLIKLAHELEVIIFFTLATPLGEWDGNKDIILTTGDREYLQELVKKYPLLRTDFEANYLHGNYGCGAVKEILYITPYGDVLGCPFLHFSLGNVFDETLKTIREKALCNNYFKHYHNICLAAEDTEFMEKYSGHFYLSSDKVRKISEEYSHRT